MELRRNGHGLALSLKYLAIALVAAVALVNLRSSSGMPQSAREGSQETPSHLTSSTAPAYYRDVLPILRQHCMVCHRAEGLGPMSFETYDAVRRYAFLIRNAAVDRTMPPSFSVPLAGRVTNDPSLTPAQISTLAAWANSKAPAGDPQDAAALPPAAAPWSIPKPDLIVKMPEPVSIPAAGNLDYVYQIVPTNFTAGRWIQMAEVLPTLRANVRQIMVVIRKPGSRWLRHAPLGKSFTTAALAAAEDHRWADDDILTVYASGSLPQKFPVTMAKYIPAGADLVFRIQYATNGAAGSDQSSVGLVFSKAKPSSRVITVALDDDQFTIPPNVSDYHVEARGVLQKNVLLLSFFPLLHLRGKQFEYDVMPAPSEARGERNPEMETLFRINYDLRWQPSYPLSEPRFLKAGTELRAVAWYDNSPSNPHNPAPDAAVKAGDQPEDEMLGGFFDVAVPANIRPREILLRRH
jgi:mono/diheme cytochrome c family protein